MSSGQPNFAQQFQTALLEFRELRKQQTRLSACGQEFVLVNNVTARLRERSESCPTQYQDDLDRLGQTAYLREGPQPPQLRTHHFRNHLAVFYNLLDVDAPSLIHEFRNNNLATLPIDIDVLKKHIKGPPDDPNFHDKFYRNQFMWCPIQFEMDMGITHNHHIISPFSRKEKIKPYRDGKGPRVNTATLYAIDVPEELVGPKLQKKMASAKIERQDDGTDSCGNRGKRYRFALKQFKPSKFEHFYNEKQMFINLENQEGMIQYIGWFRSHEPDARGGLEMYWNIVLELADFDFYTAIRTESPPISVKEILGFWQTMAEISKALASIHTVVVDRHHYLTWHGDIKPENILRVNDRFKLADPGEASMLLKSIGTSGVQKTEVIGGTRTYAAPEKAAYLDGLSQQKPEVPQTSDVWSLGCVLSISATYVVLGTQGVLIFNRLRREAIFGNTGDSSDAFHDGRVALSEVRHWHKYLREAARRNDVYTSAVLDMVDDHMLVEKDRWSAKQICQMFDKLFASTKPDESRVPRSLHNLLQRIDLQSEQMYDQHSGIRRVDSDDAAKQIPQAPNLPPAAVEFESRRKLLEQAIQPVAQRSQDRTAPPSHSRNPSFDFHLTTPTVISEQGPTKIPLSDIRNVQRPMTPSNELSMSRISTQLQFPNSPATTRKAITVWHVRKELIKKGMGYKPSVRSFSSLFNKQPMAVKGKNISDNLEHLDQRLEVEFKNRDIVYLVDNGTTMASCWSQATHLLEVLVWRSLGYDDNGMELYFTNPDTNPKATIQESRSQQLKHFTKAMAIAEPAEAQSSAQVVNTTIVPELTRIINGYTRALASKSPPRKKTIIVLTDGIWNGMRMENTIDVYLRSIFYELRDLHGDLPYIQPGRVQEQRDISKIRPVTLQFVQFGDDLNAVERLRRLDDDMKLYGCPDLIDTEHADGDIYKMFLGSLCQDIDKRMRVMVGPAISPSPSIERQPSHLVSRSSSHRQSTPQSPLECSSTAVPQTPIQASYQLDQVPLVHHPSPSSTQHHELPASAEDPRRPNVSIPNQMSSTIMLTSPASSLTFASPEHTSLMWSSPPHGDTQQQQQQQSPVTPTSLTSSSPPVTPSRSRRQ